ncbi:uncharacterized protein LOC113203017 [Frankliniella occidentalis]|uniref:Uncharacterized protein LOC113203017 n=1 Tax=Frankliniella occidentalis TaxID=133901 RepID=A0A9C6U9W5_FRAOC|nr:uncharacterized protein LOC113203017 [Frankliniella occidentalis]
MTRRAMMDDRPSSRGTPTGTPMPGTPMPGTPPSSLSAQSPSAAPSPARQDTPAPPQQAPTPPLMLATMTPVNVDGYMYEHHQTSEHHHLPHPHQPPVIYSTASLTDHQGLPVPVGVSDDGLMDGTGVVVYQQQVPQNTVLVLSELVDDMSPVLQLRTRRKDVDGSPGDPDVDGHPASGGEVDGGQWRSSLEHPLTAATSAMLNINSGPEDPANPSSNGSNPPPMSFAVYDYKTDKLGELWS